MIIGHEKIRRTTEILVRGLLDQSKWDDRSSWNFCPIKIRVSSFKQPFRKVFSILSSNGFLCCLLSISGRMASFLSADHIHYRLILIPASLYSRSSLSKRIRFLQFFGSCHLLDQIFWAAIFFKRGVSIEKT